jgi:acetylornithine deacetylase/succinyl-diaminopimelate desuccinylase-like protein
MSVINAQVDSEMGNLISDLQSLIRQPSISARKQGLPECANLVARIMNKAGINAEVLYLNYDSQTKVDIEHKIAAGAPSYSIWRSQVQGKS